MDLAVVIPAHDAAAWLPMQLKALQTQAFTGDWEVLVIDNRSTDGTADLVRRHAEEWSRLRLLVANERADKSYAMHAGVAATNAKAIAFCDADDVVAGGWVQAIAEGLREHEVVTGPHELDALNPPWLARSRGRSGDEAPTGGFFGIFPCIRGANWGIRRATWDALGGTNEAFHPVEDVEFSMRCWLNDVEIVGLPGAIVHYRYRGDARSLWRQGLAYGSHRPMIARLLREARQPAPPPLAGWRSWLLLVASAPKAVTRTGRARWLWIGGNRFGQVIGSIRYRTLML